MGVLLIILSTFASMFFYRTECLTPKEYIINILNGCIIMAHSLSGRIVSTTPDTFINKEQYFIPVNPKLVDILLNTIQKEGKIPLYSEGVFNRAIFIASKLKSKIINTYHTHNIPNISMGVGKTIFNNDLIYYIFVHTYNGTILYQLIDSDIKLTKNIILEIKPNTILNRIYI
jgi:hypothetical protein